MICGRLEKYALEMLCVREGRECVHVVSVDQRGQERTLQHQLAALRRLDALDVVLVGVDLPVLEREEELRALRDVVSVK